jgi:hypothetical protein
VLWSAEDGRYHMFLSELAHSCGMGCWSANSQVVLGLYPIVTSQYSSTTLCQVFYHIQ